LLGVTPNRSTKTLDINPIIGEGYESVILEGVQAFGQKFTVSVREGSKVIPEGEMLTPGFL
jgi:hypothetical protein